MNPQVAIIRDGYSDFLVLKKFITSIFQHHHLIELVDDNFFEFDSLNITNALSTYFSKSHKENHSLFGVFASEFRRQIGQVLFTAVKKFAKEKDLDLTHKDIIILNGDAEKILGSKQKYFEDWAYSINSIIWLAIEEFYDKMVEQGYDYSQLPLILPIILYPSSEILVASCIDDFDKTNYREFNAKPALKQKVYDTDSISEAIQNGTMKEVLDIFVIPKSLSKVYKDLPEIRKFMQILTFEVRKE
ncbi:MAG: hypothetical protein EAZ85_02925 [Bacteroidetes bacterium]|nr:MAG: hypothetical protein EAZ85_02925 [Bacteroidota bacterium]TAG85371.1 MAG: hypothetical protein EAZ20_15325 [Bacteroidota bacterium]